MINYHNNEHVFICGMTQSGKTYFAAQFYKAIKPGHIVVLDVKFEIELTNAVIVTNVFESRINEILNSGKNVIVRVEGQELFNYVADIVFRRGNTILWIDEGPEVVPEAGLSESFKRLYTRGASRKAVCWTLTQRPALVSKTAISQSRHTFVFSLVLSIDKRVICSNIPIDLSDFDKLRDHNFLHYCQGDTCARLCPPI